MWYQSISNTRWYNFRHIIAEFKDFKIYSKYNHILFQNRTEQNRTELLLHYMYYSL